MVAAALWLAYLIPTVLRRREYMATERNAVRLQQTLRILAETAEVPREIRVEATARDAAAQERILKRYQERAAAKARAEAVGAQARTETVSTQARAAIAASGVSRPGRMLRRARAMTSLMLLAAMVAVGWGTVQLAAGGSWLILALSGGAMLGCIGVLGRLATAGRRNSAAASSQPEVASTVPERDYPYDHAEVEPPVVARSTWTPTPIPKPLYQSPGSIAASSMASLDAAVELRRAAARSELAERAARLTPQPTPLRRPVASALAASAPDASGAGRFALMGRIDDLGGVDETQGAVLDLDAALRRRRAAS